MVVIKLVSNSSKVKERRIIALLKLKMKSKKTKATKWGTQSSAV